jgi:hypothetical protein
MLTADPQAGSARRLLISELAFNLAMNPGGNAPRGALLRWLEGLKRLAPELCAMASLNVAHFLWEVLELDDETWAEVETETELEAAPKEAPAASESLLFRLDEDKTVGRALREAMAGFEQAAGKALTAEDDVSHRLADVRSMLMCYASYRELAIRLPQASPITLPPEPSPPLVEPASANVASATN